MVEYCPLVIFIENVLEILEKGLLNMKLRNFEF